ncbi:MAG: hypothetical protein HKN75_01820 [Bacteroidia bacterium]|nr:hypothetical protein [Bacteroidia bacterium]
MMKKFILPAILLLGVAFSSFAQDQDKEKEEINKHVLKSQELLEKGKYRESASEMQEAINLINDIIGAQILESLPETINDLESSTAEDQTTSLGSLMGAGITVTRNYHNEKGEVIMVTITPNSPQLNMVETFLANPDDYKDASHIGEAIKVGKRDAMLKFDDSNEVTFGFLQMPLGNTLITMRGDRIESPESMVKFAASFDYKALGKALGVVVAEE